MKIGNRQISLCKFRNVYKIKVFKNILSLAVFLVKSNIDKI